MAPPLHSESNPDPVCEPHTDGSPPPVAQPSSAITAAVRFWHIARHWLASTRAVQRYRLKMHELALLTHSPVRRSGLMTRLATMPAAQQHHQFLSLTSFSMEMSQDNRLDLLTELAYAISVLPQETKSVAFGQLTAALERQQPAAGLALPLMVASTALGELPDHHRFDAHVALSRLLRRCAGALHHADCLAVYTRIARALGHLPPGCRLAAYIELIDSVAKLPRAQLARLYQRLRREIIVLPQGLRARLVLIDAELGMA